MTKPGFLYIAQNKDEPSLLKVGMTTRSPEDRVKELAGQTTLSKWEIVASFYANDGRYAEKLAHLKLEALGPLVRPHPRKELFNVNIVEAQRLCQEAVEVCNQREVEEPILYEGSVSHPLKEITQFIQSFMVNNVPLGRLMVAANRGCASSEKALARKGVQLVCCDLKEPCFKLSVDKSSAFGQLAFAMGCSLESLCDIPEKHIIRVTLS